MSIQNSSLANPTTTNIFTASTGTDYAITTVIFCNTSVLDDAFLDLWVVPNNSVAGIPQNQILKSVKIPKTETFVMDSEKFILSDGDSMWGQVQPLAVDGLVTACVSSVIIS
jgi:hypothetical protein